MVSGPVVELGLLLVNGPRSKLPLGLFISFCHHHRRHQMIPPPQVRHHHLSNRLSIVPVHLPSISRRYHLLLPSHHIRLRLEKLSYHRHHRSLNYLILMLLRGRRNRQRNARRATSQNYRQLSPSKRNPDLTRYLPNLVLPIHN